MVIINIASNNKLHCSCFPCTNPLYKILIPFNTHKHPNYMHYTGRSSVACFNVWSDFALERGGERTSLIGLEQWETDALGLCSHRLVGSVPQGNTAGPLGARACGSTGGRVILGWYSRSPRSSRPFQGNGYWPKSSRHALFGIFSPSLYFSFSALLCFPRAIIRADRLVGRGIRRFLSSFYLLIPFSFRWA